MAIPKRIFYVWGYNEKKKRDVDLCLLSWHREMPDYEIIEINEKSVKYFNFQEELKRNKYFRMVYDRKMYAFVSDYIRIKVLYEHGGIYLDTDVCVLKTLDRFLQTPAFVGIEGNSKEIGKEWVEPAILGAEKGNKFLKQILEFYENQIMKSKFFVLPDIFGIFLEKLYEIKNFPDKEKQEIIKCDDIVLYPERFFIPYRLNEDFSVDCIEDDTHTIHFWNGSWNNDKVFYYQKNKGKYPLFILDLFFSIKRVIDFIFKIYSIKKANKSIKYIRIFGINKVLKEKEVKFEH